MTRKDIFKFVALTVKGESPEKWDRTQAQVRAMSPGAGIFLDEEIPDSQVQAEWKKCLLGLEIAQSRPLDGTEIRKALDNFANRTAKKN